MCGRILLAPINRQTGGSSLSSSLTEAAVGPGGRAVPGPNLTAFGTQERSMRTERKIRIQLNQKVSLEKDIWVGRLENVYPRSRA